MKYILMLKYFINIPNFLILTFLSMQIFDHGPISVQKIIRLLASDTTFDFKLHWDQLLKDSRKSVSFFFSKFYRIIYFIFSFRSNLENN